MKSGILNEVKCVMKHIVLAGLIAGYLIVTLSGHLQVLASVINSGGEPHQVTSAKKSHPIDSRPVWVYKKHLLPPTKKVEAPTEATLSITPSRPTPAFVIIQAPADSTVNLHFVYLPYRPRDPPSA